MIFAGQVSAISSLCLCLPSWHEERGMQCRYIRFSLSNHRGSGRLSSYLCSSSVEIVFDAGRFLRVRGVWSEIPILFKVLWIHVDF